MSKIVSLLIVFLIVVADIYLIATDKDSISSVIYTASKDWLIIPFLFGVLIGHLFWPIRPKT